jgi:hypothetical protein
MDPDTLLFPASFLKLVFLTISQHTNHMTSIEGTNLFMHVANNAVGKNSLLALYVTWTQAEAANQQKQEGCRKTDKPYMAVLAAAAEKLSLEARKPGAAIWTPKLHLGRKQCTLRWLCFHAAILKLSERTTYFHTCMT